MPTAVRLVSEGLATELTRVLVLERVLGGRVLFQGVTLGKAFLAVQALKVPPLLVNGGHVLLEAGRLDDLLTNRAVDILVGDDHLVVDKADVPVHVGEVSEHLAALAALVFGLLVVDRTDVLLEAERPGQDLAAEIAFPLVALLVDVLHVFGHGLLENDFTTLRAIDVVLVLFPTVVRFSVLEIAAFGASSS